jgi:hypothetical protein
MKTKYFFLAAIAATFASCANDEYIGDTSPNAIQETTDGSIMFGSGFKAVTRADSYGAAAADLLGNKFIVTGVKGDGTGTGQTPVFQSYTVDWAQNTAGTTESNTADWEYVTRGNLFGLAGAQSIKYWDFSTTAYDFAAYSVGNGNTITAKTTSNINSDPAPGVGVIYATPIAYNATQIAASDPARYEITNAYMLRGSRDDLTKCYITDMKTVAKAAYKGEVQLSFRSLASKVRMALYETIPGYSVKNVFFYTDASTTIATGPSSNANATLFGTDAFYTSGTYTVSFPHIGSGHNPSNDNNSDYNKAHVTISGSATTSTQNFSTLNYTTDLTDHEAAGNYLKRASNDPSFAGTGTFYQTVLPNEEGVTLTLRVDYTLVSTDGSGEEITVHGANAYVPAAYTKWLPNYAYTYIFKISDNSNGWTSTSTSDPEGLYPITFDAVVLDNEETGHQTTITTVATPSITTYQKGHVYSASNEYVVGDIYAQVVGDGTLKEDLNLTTPFVKTYFYKLSAGKTEAEVMDALNIREGEEAGEITGRNGLVLTPKTIDKTITTIPGEDGNDINLATEGKAVKLSPADAGTYAFVYQVSAGAAEEFNTAVVTSGSAPTDWVASDANVYYSDFNCTSKVTTAWVAGTYYKKYTNLNNNYAVKVIKVQ